MAGRRKLKPLRQAMAQWGKPPPEGKNPEFKLPGMTRGIQIVSQEEAEEASMVVCNTSDLPSPFIDNVTTTCALCNASIYHRPHVPRKPMKVCVHCALSLAKSDVN